MLRDTEDTEQIIERVAALDIGKAELVACVRVPSATQLERRQMYVAITRARDSVWAGIRKAPHSDHSIPAQIGHSSA